MSVSPFKHYGKRAYIIEVREEGQHLWQAVGNIGHLDNNVFFRDFAPVVSASQLSSHDAWIRAEALVLRLIEEMDG